ncbi:MAG: beta strand repeat-containing protein [Elainella sp.]
MTGGISLSGSLPQINSNIAFVGGNNTINGNNNRIFFVAGGTVSFANLTLTGGVARGGDGNPGESAANSDRFGLVGAAGGGGGGGAGLGGALYMDSGAVTLTNVVFNNNQAIGGNGGRGGGAGLGSSITSGSTNISATANGGPAGSGSSGGAGSFSGGGSGGSASARITSPDLSTSPAPGSKGGFGGGGGGGGAAVVATDASLGPDSSDGGSGGNFGGNGGRGGSIVSGGGGGISIDVQGGGGGGGAGLGGAIFLRSGILTLDTVSFNNNSATGGSSGGVRSTAGLGKGGAIFVLDSLTNSNGNNLGMPSSLPTIQGTNVSFSGNSAADDTSTATDNDNIYGASLPLPVPNTDPTTTGIANVTVNEDAPATVINLFDVFADAQTPDSSLIYSVRANSNTGLVGTSITGGNLTLTYTANAFGTANLTVRATDPGGRFVDTSFSITVSPVNDAPVVNLPSSPQVVPLSNVITGLSVSDIDAGNSPVRVTLTLLGGSLTVNSSVSGGIPSSGITNNNSSSVTLTGTLAQINATLANAQGLRYSPGLNFLGSASLSVSINDNGNTGAGPAGGLSNTKTLALSLRDLGTFSTLRSSVTVLGTVSAANPAETYRISLTRPTTLNFNLSVFTGNADLDILSADGTTVLFSSTNPGLVAENLSRQLATGSYLVRVRRVSGATGYSLSVTQVG